VAVLGMNGSGKSTLARHFNALLLPSEGRVLVDGLDTKEEKHLWSIRDQVGMVFQNPDNQIVAAVVEEDVAFGPENQGQPPEEIRRRVVEALETVGMIHMRERAPHLLSGGQKQRVAIAGALALRPACLVLDEPTAMLDPSGRQEVVDVVRRLNRELGMTVVWITHFMEEAALADRVVVMAGAKVQSEGPPREVFTQAKRLRELRLDVPLAVAAAERLRAGGLDLPLGLLTLEELVEALCLLRSAT
jgi:energy-coupling factor transport system ATP-binding protein